MKRSDKKPLPANLIRNIEHFRPEIIAVADGRREVNADAVARIAESMSSIGLRTPITVRIVDGWKEPDGSENDGQPVLVTGAHRLAAAKSLDWKEIECFIFDSDDELDAQIWEITENLHRAELTKAERADQVAEWIRLTEEKQEQKRVRAESEKQDPEIVSGQLAPKSPGRPEGGISAASKELGIEKTQAKRAVKIASTTPAAKKAAKAAGLDNNQQALERIARKPEGEQVAEVAKIKKEREQREREKKSPPIKARSQGARRQYRIPVNTLLDAFNAAHPIVRREMVLRNLDWFRKAVEELAR